MIFLPKGLKSGGVVDPDDLADEFRAASQLANDAGWWQFAKAAFDSATGHALLEQETHVSVLSSVPAIASAGILGITGVAIDPVLTGGSVNAHLWDIPYNSGLHSIGDGDVEIKWTSEYPEMVLQLFSFNYLKATATDLSLPANYVVRSQILLTMDGNEVSGSGPFGVPNTGKASPRGSAMGEIASTLVTVHFLDAGSHVADAVAGQAPATPNPSAGEDVVSPLDSPPDAGVVIAHRGHHIVRFGRGQWRNI